MKKREIAKLRQQLNLSQAVFASVLNVSVKTVQAWE
ncbi:MAG TPA: helix-turn-helix domain-containing protein [Blastocatellia bacterium]